MKLHPMRFPHGLRAAVFFLIAPCATAFCAPPPLGNGSFEDGQTSPSGWILSLSGSWASGDAHSGRRFLRGRTTQPQVVGVSESIPVEPDTDYRLAGWLRVDHGKGMLRVELLDGGKTVGAHDAPVLQRSPAWRYVALEWNSGKANAARVAFDVTGQADLDDVQLAPVATSYMGNKGVEGDARGRIGFWSEEKIDALLPGKRAGQWRLDAEVKREGKSSLQLTSTGDWYAWSSLNYAVPAWTDRVTLSGWARCDEASNAQILACWTDDMQKVLRVDASAPLRRASWQLAQLTATAPRNATSVRLVAVARGGKVWFDDFDLQRGGAEGPRARVFVNQIGYELHGPKNAVIATNFFPPGASCQLALVNADGKVLWRGDVPCGGRIYGGTDSDWGWYFWRADFSSCTRAEGSYRLVAVAGRVKSESPSFVIRRGALLRETAQSGVDFFFIQRCGFEVPGWHKACHLDDAKLPDGTHIDATGGWHSAGDYNKLMYENGDGGVAFALLSAFRAAPDLFQRFDRDHDGVCDALDEASWGARFVAKMQVPETGAMRNHVNQGPARDWMKWTAPDLHTDNLVGTSDDPVIQPGAGNSPLVIGAWARLCTLPDQRGVKSNYLDPARRLWNHASKNGTQLGSPHLLMSALEMHNATTDASFLDYARRSVESLLAQQVKQGRMRGAFGSYGELTAGALAQFALAHPRDALAANIKTALKDYITFCVSTADDPFGLSKQIVGDSERFFPPDMGNNFQLLQRAWAAASAYRVTGDRRALVFALDHMDWILGKNPLNLCMFEGKGAFNPPRYHHRYNMIPGHERGAVPGCIPNGIVQDLGLADRPGFDLSIVGGRSPSYRTSEPWLVHNMWYLLAAGELHKAMGQ